MTTMRPVMIRHARIFEFAKCLITIIIIIIIIITGRIRDSRLTEFFRIRFFLCEVGRRLSVVSGDARETSFLFQLLSILIQRFNSVLIQESFCSNDEDLDL